MNNAGQLMDVKDQQAALSQDAACNPSCTWWLAATVLALVDLVVSLNAECDHVTDLVRLIVLEGS